MEIRERTPRGDGIRHVDTPATIAKLRDAHVTTYFYLVLHAASDWDDLQREFMPAAERAGIDVWVYLVPPSECCSKPYGTDFVRWAEEIAQLSRRHRNLKGWAMDDFSSNLTTFTPEYTRTLRSAARKIDPNLRFFPVLYHDDYGDAFLASYAAHLDGAIFPYTIDFEKADGVGEALKRIDATLDAFGLDLVLMVYSTKMSVAEYPPSATYVAGALRTGLEAMRRGEILGVTTYAMVKQFEKEECGFANHLNLTVPSEVPTKPGDFVSAGQTIRIDPAAGRYQLRFFEQDSYPVATAGYHFKQLLIDGQVVWDQDVASDDALAWVERTFDLTPHVQGKSSAVLSFRLYDKKGVSNFGIRVSVANLDATGFTIDDRDFTKDTGWNFAQQGPGSARRAHYLCDPDRQRHVYEAVRDLYAEYRVRKP
ncbi:MAG: hypothetical protein H0W18_16745 [Acidobacteria bacterium]|nr:hypothetical protein [Acidobacteriota bacterium]